MVGCAVSPVCFAPVTEAGIGSISSESAQFFNRLITPPTPGGAIETAYATFIDGLVADGVWAKLDVAHVYAAPNTPDSEGLSQTNLVQASYQATRFRLSGARTTYTALQGYLSTAPGDHIDSRFNPTTAVSPKHTQNDCSMAVFILSTTQVSQAAVVTKDSSNNVIGNTQITPKWSNGFAYASMYHTAADMGASTAFDTSGFFLAQRTASNAQALYRNGATIVTGTQASVAPGNGTIRASCRQQTGALFIGASLNSTERTALETGIRTLFTSLGVTVP